MPFQCKQNTKRGRNIFDSSTLINISPRRLYYSMILVWGIINRYTFHAFRFHHLQITCEARLVIEPPSQNEATVKKKGNRYRQLVFYTGEKRCTYTSNFSCKLSCYWAVSVMLTLNERGIVHQDTRYFSVLLPPGIP